MSSSALSFRTIHTSSADYSKTYVQLIIPNLSLSTYPVSPRGSLALNTDTDIPYYSDGSAWIPFLTLFPNAIDAYIPNDYSTIQLAVADGKSRICVLSDITETVTTSLTESLWIFIRTGVTVTSEISPVFSNDSGGALQLYIQGSYGGSIEWNPTQSDVFCTCNTQIGSSLILDTIIFVNGSTVDGANLTDNSVTIINSLIIAANHNNCGINLNGVAPNHLTDVYFVGTGVTCTDVITVANSSIASTMENVQFLGTFGAVIGHINRCTASNITFQHSGSTKFVIGYDSSAGTCNVNNFANQSTGSLDVDIEGNNIQISGLIIDGTLATKSLSDAKIDNSFAGLLVTDVSSLVNLTAFSDTGGQTTNFEASDSSISNCRFSGPLVINADRVKISNITCPSFSISDVDLACISNLYCWRLENLGGDGHTISDLIVDYSSQNGSPVQLVSSVQNMVMSNLVLQYNVNETSDPTWTFSNDNNQFINCRFSDTSGGTSVPGFTIVVNGNDNQFTNCILGIGGGATGSSLTFNGSGGTAIGVKTNLGVTGAANTAANSFI